MTTNTPETRLSGPNGTFFLLSGSVLRAGSSDFERVWHLGSDGTLLPQSFLDRVSGIEWVVPETSPAETGEAAAATLTEIPRSSILEADSLTAVLRLRGNSGSVTYRFQIFPNVRGVCLVRQSETVPAEIPAQTPDSPDSTAAAPTGIETDEVAVAPLVPPVDTGRIDGFALTPQHLRLIHVSLQDQTDNYNEMAWEREWLLHTSEKTITLPGCLFAVEDTLSGAGLIFLKEAPLPYARPNPTEFDLKVAPAARRVTLYGEPAETEGAEYLVIVLTYEGGPFGRVAALQHYQRARRPYVPGRDGLHLSNTWGDRNRDERIQADFLTQEIEAGARLGVDIIQIDDGWQTGTTSNSVRAQTEGGVWEGFYAARDNFWQVNKERFPNGLEPLVTDARERGLRFGLWFGPDSSDDFAAWERDAATILDLHRTLNVDYFKIDGVKVRTRTGERNLYAFFDRVLQESAGKIVFDLDITAETRPGYFGVLNNGPLFLENRYTDWHRYWPHQTLRNLWKLAHYVDPLRLRMEWLNHTRHTDKYPNDPLAPQAYRPDYLFATVMFSSPLGWFEVSSLPESYFTEAAPLIATWKEHREKVFGGTILPIGNAPDGVAWTGFVAVVPDGLYVLAFREHHPNSTETIPLPFVADSDAPRAGIRLGGEGEVHLLPNRTLSVFVPDSQRFVFAYIDGVRPRHNAKSSQPT